MHAIKSTLILAAVLGLASGCTERQDVRESTAKGHASSADNGIPEVVARPSGEVEVRMPGGCVALYDRNGGLITRGSSCSASDRRRADDAINSYRREQGLGGGSARQGTGTGAAERACVAAVAKRVGTSPSRLSVLDVKGAQAGIGVTVKVPGATAPYSCLSDKQGNVQGVAFTGDEGRL
jgi:hypothetical protein